MNHRHQLSTTAAADGLQLGSGLRRIVCLTALLVIFVASVRAVDYKIKVGGVTVTSSNAKDPGYTNRCTTASLSEKLNVFPGATDNAWCAALTGRLQALSEQLNAISTTRQTSPVALAGMLRLAHIDAFMGVKGVREALGSGG